MAVVTPVPQDPNEAASKRWHFRQELQKVRTAITMVRKDLPVADEYKIVAALCEEIDDLTNQAMEELSPQPKERVSYKKPRFPWDK